LTVLTLFLANFKIICTFIKRACHRKCVTSVVFTCHDYFEMWTRKLILYVQNKPRCFNFVKLVSYICLSRFNYEVFFVTFFFPYRRISVANRTYHSGRICSDKLHIKQYLNNLSLYEQLYPPFGW